MKAIVRILKFLFFCFLVVAILMFYFLYSISVPKKSGFKTVFKVAKGDGAGVIARNLKNEGLIDNALCFRLLVRFAHAQTKIKAGDYELNSDMNSISILEKLVKGDVIMRAFTIPEGSTLKDMAKIFDEKQIIRQDDFTNLTEDNKSIKIGEICPAKLEGFLFPETYHISYDASPEDVIRAMTKMFEQKALPLYNVSALKKRFSLTEVITLASLVEKEAKLNKERPVIAAVYLNRIKLDMPLECDATIQYVLKDIKPNLTYEDLKTESPYNTYLNRGLPPGPICNPGYPSIEAVFSPAKAKYLFYVLNDRKGDGSHVFTTSYKDHLRAIENYQSR